MLFFLGGKYPISMNFQIHTFYIVGWEEKADINH